MEPDTVRCCKHIIECCNVVSRSYLHITSEHISDKKIIHSGNDEVHKSLANCTYCQSDEYQSDKIESRRRRAANNANQKASLERKRLRSSIPPLPQFNELIIAKNEIINESDDESITTTIQESSWW